MLSRITNHFRNVSTTDIDPDNAVEEVLEMLENEDEEEEEKDDTNV